jgi:hypothetical protein
MADDARPRSFARDEWRPEGADYPILARERNYGSAQPYILWEK